MLHIKYYILDKKSKCEQKDKCFLFLGIINQAVGYESTDYLNASKYCKHNGMELSNEVVLEDMIKTKQITPMPYSYYWVPITRYLQLYWRSVDGIDVQRKFI